MSKGTVFKLKADAKDFEVAEDFDRNNTLEYTQKTVDGYIEALTIHDEDDRRITVWLNEEGKLEGLPPNFVIVSGGEIADVVLGDVLITSTDNEGETVPLTDKEVEVVKSKFDFSKGAIIGTQFYEKMLEL